jgi:hypothetical protein
MGGLAGAGGFCGKPEPLVAGVEVPGVFGGGAVLALIAAARRVLIAAKDGQSE